MEEIKEFLESSSINGLALISSTRRFVRLFWILVVLGGFTGAIYMILESIENWRKNPISTTFNTKPINELTFPNVTVCPPKGLYLNLNNDIRKSEKLTINKDLRNKLRDYSVQVIQNEFYQEFMEIQLEDPDRFYNWYHGYTRMDYSYSDPALDGAIYHVIRTTATSGNISTPYFGEKFNAEKYERIMRADIRIHVPTNEQDKNASINVKFEKDSLAKTVAESYPPGGYIQSHVTRWNSSFPVTRVWGPMYVLKYLRQRTPEDDIELIDLTLMPGFRLTWNYDKHVEPYIDRENVQTSSNYRLNFVRLVNIIDRTHLDLESIWKIVNETRHLLLLENPVPECNSHKTLLDSFVVNRGRYKD